MSFSLASFLIAGVANAFSLTFFSSFVSCLGTLNKLPEPSLASSSSPTTPLEPFFSSLCSSFFSSTLDSSLTVSPASPIVTNVSPTSTVSPSLK